MLFSEVYGSYFRVVAAVLEEAVKGGLTDRRLTELVREKAFAESTLSIPAALKTGAWPLLTEDMTAVIRREPTLPLTLLEKRWLKALLQDPRIALFSPDATGLEDVEPLCRPDTFVFFDRYADGDPYEDETYIDNFRVILGAIREKKALRVRFRSHAGLRHSLVCLPYRLEYSAKDDKFRLLARGKHDGHTINVARIRGCTALEPLDAEAWEAPKEHTRELTVVLRDERNGLERALLHFSHFEKETVRLDGQRYQIKLRYDREDETELLIRVLSFGPVLEAVSPESFVDLIRERLAKQRRLTPRFYGKKA